MRTVPMARRICPNRGMGVGVFGWMNWNAVAEATGSKREEEEGGKEAGLGLSTAGQDADEEVGERRGWSVEGSWADDHGCICFEVRCREDSFPVDDAKLLQKSGFCNI